MEMVDIVDENDNVLYQESKVEAHKKGLLHRTVIAEVIGSDGRWVLIKQAPNRQDAGQLVSPIGGHVMADEGLEEALKREAYEEMGLKDIKYKFIGKSILSREVLGRKENHYFIVYEIYSDQEPVLNHESVSFERFSKEDLERRIKENPKEFGRSLYFVLENIYRKTYV